LLAEIYGWFTEGSNTADLKEAKALLEELSAWHTASDESFKNVAFRNGFPVRRDLFTFSNTVDF
jgi:hypothetical protein